MNANYEYEVTIVLKSSIQVGRDEKQPNKQEAATGFLMYLFGEGAPQIAEDYLDNYTVKKTYVGKTGRQCSCCGEVFDYRDMVLYDGLIWHCKPCQLEIDRIA